MKKLLFLIILLILSQGLLFAQVAINTDNSLPDNSAMLDVKSTTKGILIPRMNLTERDAISNPATGLLIFCTSNNQYYSNKGSLSTPNWIMVSSQWVTNDQNISYNSGNVGIGTSTPASSAILEVTSTTKGILIPRLTTAQRLAIASPAEGLLVYDTNLGAFFYYHTGAWTLNLNSSNGWSLTGNSGTNPATNFLGTTDNQALVFKVNNIRSGLIEVSGNSGYGYQALINNTTGYNNSAFGTGALFTSNGNHNCAFGAGALYSNTAGSGNVAIGEQALYSNTSGTYNTALGFGADVGSNSLTNSTAIGNAAIASSSNEMRLGNASVSSLYCMGAYTPTTTSPANVYVSSTGQIMRTTNAPVTVHTIGESYGGRIVFYVYDGGLHGLIAATADQSTGIRWYGGTYTNTCARGDGLGAGLINTVIIIANQGPVDGNTFAARVCNEYTATFGGVVYGDWYLPSRYELNLMYLQKIVIGGFADEIYWSSTEKNNSYVWLQDFLNGYQAYYLKGSLYYVRAVRAF